jgi:hypothetical protein
LPADPRPNHLKILGANSKAWPVCHSQVFNACKLHTVQKTDHEEFEISQHEALASMMQRQTVITNHNCLQIALLLMMRRQQQPQTASFLICRQGY